MAKKRSFKPNWLLIGGGLAAAYYVWKSQTAKTVSGIFGTAKIKSIHFTGKRWFQSSYGNTYHTVEVFVNDKYVGTSPITYGYGTQYEQTGIDILKKNGYIKDYDLSESFWRYCQEKGIEYSSYAKDVKKKSQL